MSGQDPDALSACDILDVAEAVLVDSVMVGDLEAAHARVLAALDEMIPSRETWGLLPHQRQAAAAAEGMFAASRPRTSDTSTI